MLALGGGELWTSRPIRFIPDERLSVSTGQEAEWTPELDWTLCPRETCSYAKNRSPVVWFVAYLLYWLRFRFLFFMYLPEITWRLR
jgi:hypothetical protein